MKPTLRLILSIFCLSLVFGLNAQTSSVTYSTPGLATFNVPFGVTQITVEVWGAGGAGGTISGNGAKYNLGAGGGGGGAYARKIISVTPCQTITYAVGAGGNSGSAGGDSWAFNASTVMAKGGLSAPGGRDSYGASGGSATSSIGDFKYSGGNGGNGTSSTTFGGGGGSSAGNSSNGNSGLGSLGGTAPTGAASGGNGKSGSDGSGSNGDSPGGGGGGALKSSNGTEIGGSGGNGQVKISWNTVQSNLTATNGTNATCDAFSANWTAESSATAYFLDVSTVNTFATFVSGYNNLNVGNVTTRNITGLTAGTTYYYQVRASNSCGTSISSNIITYTTCANDPVYPTEAMIHFDGVDDYLSGSSFIKGLYDATIMAWVKTDSGNTTTMTIAGEDLACKLWLKNGNKPMFTLKTKLQAEKKIGGCENCIINFDEWHHITGSYSSSTGLIKLYIDGNLVDMYSIAMGDPIVVSTDANNTFEIGRFSNKLTQGEYFKGDIDEVRVFNTALTDSQLQQMVYQEIENNNGSIRGTVIGKDIIDNTTKSKVPWENLIAYYPMTDIKNNKTIDYSNNDHELTLNNIETILEQTAPMPYVTGFDGNWESNSIWLHGDVWDIEDVVNSKDNGIIKISNNITTNSSIKTLGLIIDEGKTLTVNGDHEIYNSWFLNLGGTLDLMNDSQLVQTTTSDLVTSATGKLLRRQEGTSNAFRYNYWSSPVGIKGATGLIDNNAATNNTNNTAFTLNMLKDETGFNMQFASAYNQAGKISTYWLYTFKNGVTYWDWASVKPNTLLEPGVGYTQKGTGNAGLQQQYIFEGKPNNGTIIVKVTDKGGPGSVTNVSKTEYLLGNPYPSALDIHKFIDDNKGIIGGTVQLWQQWAGNSHNLNEYQGGYAHVNKLGAIRASQFTGIYGATLGTLEGTLPPERYLPIGQAFIAEIVASGNVVFNNSQRKFVKEIDAYGVVGSILSLFKSGNKQSKSSNGPEGNDNNSMKKIRLEFNSVVGPKTKRELLLGFSESTTDGFDYGYDSENIEVNNNDFNLDLEGKNMNMQAYAPITSDKAVPLNFKSSGNNTFEIKATELKNIDEDQEVYLRDNETDTYFDLRQGTAYKFSSTQGKFNKRFELVFQSKQQSLSAEEIMAPENFIYYQNTTNTLYGKKLKASIDKLAIVNIRGQTVLEFNNVSQDMLTNGMKITGVATGTYIAWFKAQTGQVFTKKFIVN